MLVNGSTKMSLWDLAGLVFIALCFSSGMWLIYVLVNGSTKMSFWELAGLVCSLHYISGLVCSWLKYVLVNDSTKMSCSHVAGKLMLCVLASMHLCESLQVRLLMFPPTHPQRRGSGGLIMYVFWSHLRFNFIPCKMHFYPGISAFLLFNQV